MTSHTPERLCDTDVNHIYTYAFVEGCKDLTPAQCPQCSLSRSHTHTHSIRASCLSGGPTEQMDRDAALSLSLRSSASPRETEKVACAREMEGPRKESPLDGGTLRSIYNKSPASAFPMRHAQTPPGVRVCVSVYLLLSV